LGQILKNQDIKRPKSRVDQLVTRHSFKLSAKARSKGRVPLFLVSQQNLNPSLLLTHLTHTNNRWKRIRNEKITKIKIVKNSTKQTTKHYKGQFSKHSKNSLYVALLLVEFKHDLLNFRWDSYNILNHLKWIKKRKLWNLKVARVRREGKKKNTFCKLKSFFFSLLFFHYYFSFRLQIWFLKLEEVLQSHFKSLKMKHIWYK